MPSDLKTLYQNTQAVLTQEPEKAKARFEVSTRQVEGLRSEARLRGFHLAVDEPEALGGTDTAPNPVELLLAALGTCQEITYRLYADALGIPLDGVSVELTGDLDLRGFLAVDPEVRPGYQRIAAKVTIDSPAAPDRIAALKEVVDRHCPLLDMLRQPTPVELSLAHNSRATPAVAGG